MNPSIDEYDSVNPFGLEAESDFHTTRRNITLSIIRYQLRNIENPRILDVGCGKGLITIFIKQEIPNLIIDAIDISSKAIEHAINNSSEINFSVADAIDFKGYGYKYDIILLNNVYEHLENPVGILKNLKNLLVSNGFVIISTPNRYNTRNVLKKFFGFKITIPKYHICEYSIGQLYDQHNYVGLKIQRIIIPKLKTDKFKLIAYIIFNLMEPFINWYFKLLNSRTRTGRLLFIVSRNI
ncbi:MAG: class I SAM-dependent methyltransferase [Bacteroidales bacterium]|nr:class I SAM-dependent methyltransferase [Bacteroidales bacterium]